VKDITGGKMVPVVYDSVGKDTFLKSLDCLAPLGLVALFGQWSGSVDPINLGGGRRSLPSPDPADPEDVVRLHLRRAASRRLDRVRLRDAPCGGSGGLLRNAGG
jgi:threonine dehydrogenase-like Zn-dependent dehydrogenase